MIIVVNSTALVSGGALSILKQFLSKVPSENTYHIFIHEKLEGLVEGGDNVVFHYVSFNGFLARIWWDQYGFRKKVDALAIKVDKIVSLQNTAVRYKGVTPQILYLHQPLPFDNIKFNLFKSNELRLFLYSNVYIHFVRMNLSSVSHLVVQTNWMKDACIKKLPFEAEKVHVIRPEFILPINSSKLDCERQMTDIYTLFFPSAPIVYKNHCFMLKVLQGVSECVVMHVTFFKGDFADFDSQVEKLGLKDRVVYLGTLSFENVLKNYHSCDLVVFPSKAETFGLPLLEAASLGKSLVVADKMYARDVLEQYTAVEYCSLENVSDWQTTIEKIRTSEIKLFANEFKYDSNWSDFFSLLESK